MRWRMLRSVSAGPTMMVPGMVGLSTDAPTDARRDAEFVHGIGDDAGAVAQRLEAPDHALGRARPLIIRMRSAAMRPVSFLSATFTASSRVYTCGVGGKGPSHVK